MTYLASEACTRTGYAVNASGGEYAKVALVNAWACNSIRHSIDTGHGRGIAAYIFERDGAIPYRGTVASLKDGLKMTDKLPAQKTSKPI